MKTLFQRLMETPPSDGSAGGQTGATSTPGDASASVPSSPASDIVTPDFAELAEWDESLVPEEAVAPAKEPGASAQPSAATQPGASTPPATSVPAAPVVPVPPVPPAAQATPPVQATPPAQEQPAAPVIPPAANESPTSLEAHRAKALPELEKLYALAPEELEEFRVAPETALPKLAARLHFEVVMSAYQAVQSRLPEMVAGFNAHDRQVQQANDAFYTKWPDLKGDANLTQIKGAIKAYKAANPTATQEQVINGAGAMVMISQGKNPFASTPPAASAAPAAPSRPAGVGASAAPMPRTQGQPTNDIEALSMAFAEGQID